MIAVDIANPDLTREHNHVVALEMANLQFSCSPIAGLGLPWHPVNDAINCLGFPRNFQQTMRSRLLGASASFDACVPWIDVEGRRQAFQAHCARRGSIDLAVSRGVGSIDPRCAHSADCVLALHRPAHLIASERLAYSSAVLSTGHEMPAAGGPLQ